MAPLGRYVAVFAALFVLYATAAWLVLRRRVEDRVLVVLILGFALAFRLPLVPGPVVLSSDLYRYVWDGRVQRAGINPYRYPPAAAELSHLRDPLIHTGINRPDKRTVYPPGAEAVYALAGRLAPDSVAGWRLIVVGAEALAVLLLLVLLRRLGVPGPAVLLYAWSPLAVFEGAQAGHVDFVMLPAVLLALCWRQRGRMALAGAALGLAALVKLYPAVLLLAWRRARDWRFPLALVGVVAAGYLLYLPGAGGNVLGFLPEYFGSAEDFNVGLRAFLTEPLGLEGAAREVVRGIVMLGLFGVLLAVLLRIGHSAREDPESLLRAGMAAAGAYLVLVPTAMHPWYAVWMLPFVAARPSPAWLWFTGAVSLSYLGYLWQPTAVPLWLRAIEFFPLYALLWWEWRCRTRVAVFIMAKAPRPGEVKTRLCPPLSGPQAADLYRSFLQDKIEQVRTLRRATPAVAYAPEAERPLFEALAPDFRLVAQRGPDLGARLANGFAEFLGNGHAGAVAIDSDTPTLPTEYLAEAVARLRRGDADLVLGPSEDGGYYLIGLRAPHPELFEGIRWSTPEVMPETLRRAEAKGLRVALLPTWYDVDTPADLARLRAALAGSQTPTPQHTRRFLTEPSR
ncbi:MAG: TIGR04282 family arsenosugar biosynthesis glycosyltransferase [Candidatus Rokubacteria bacterium]|nr:TIGR04282 family arsenosugar biosynthesis glycosyltransferase [Candidatus Rokubacteria bacterium]